MWGYITWCRSCTAIKPYVCVCACSQDLKLVVKQALELFAPSSFQNSRTQKFTACSLFLMSLLPHLRCCQLWLLLFLLQLQYKSKKEEKVAAIEEYKKLTSKRNPRNSKLEKFATFNMKQQRAIIKIMVYNLQSSIHQNPLEIEKH